MDDANMYARALYAAAARAGGIDALAKRLGVTPARVTGWIDGDGAPETAVLLQIVAIALGDDRSA
jgi:DNA-binding transcriptional regulator YdaS (Cro superfamily)